MSLELKLKNFIQEELLENEEIDSSTPLFTSGLLDSVSLVSLMSYINTNLGTQISSSDITMENINTLSSLLSLIETKKKAKS